MPPMRRRDLLACSASAALACVALAVGGGAHATPAGAATPRTGLSLIALSARRDDDGVVLNYDVLIDLSDDLKDALERGISVVFVVDAAVFRRRWYWTDRALGRAVRRWRLAYQPLTASWRVGLVGGLNQTFSTLEEAMLAITRSTQWRLVDLDQLDPEGRHYVEFSFRLDDTQLPGPMQIGLGGTAGWSMAVERSVRVE